MKRKHFASILAVAVMLTSFTMTGTIEGASRAELAAIHVNKSGNFQYWNRDSAAKEKLVSYVKDVTNPKSSNFIPVEHRLAVFDMDGTLLGERTPSYTDGVFYADRVLHDPDCKVSAEDKQFARDYWDAISQRKPVPPEIDNNLYNKLYAGLAGMTPQSLDAYAQGFMKKPVIGLTNLTYGEAFYMPMVEVISYLQSNDFTCYIVSASDRPLVRTLTRDVIHIAPNNIIGSDPQIVASHQGDTAGGSYQMTYDDTIQYGTLDRVNEKMNKVSSIVREIGIQPVLAFGNSSGDYSMFRYTLKDNPYKAEVFNVLCDDTQREYGRPERAERDKKTSDENGWNTISMKNDWKTIYGENVKKTK